jgi:DNA-binding MarR family transcriptional regulator
MRHPSSSRSRRSELADARHGSGTNRSAHAEGRSTAPVSSSPDLVSFLDASADTWSAITGGVDRDAIVVLGLVEAIVRTWKQVHEEALADFDLNLAEWTTIGMLRSSPPEFRRSPTELRRLIGQTSAGMTRILKKLGSRGLVRRRPSVSDGRGQDVILTRRGVALAEESFLALHAVQRGVVAPLAGDERRRLIEALDGLLVALRSADRP